MLMVAVTAYISFRLDQVINNDYTYLVDSFLMSTVALGGAVNVMPLIFAKVPQTRANVKKFRLALTSGKTRFIMFSLSTEILGQGPKISVERERELDDNGCQVW